ncbi:MAG: hypothetical protein IJJ03_04100 [Mogibacterium sp.]|nr:hypothetical protein [Mogibacterium sp.]MBQ6150819.1 hypothetical protein [Mogibacterium sp.]
MKKTTKLLALVMAIMMVFALGLSACGSKSEEPAADEGQNPAMNYVGNYVCGRAAILIGATDEENGMNAIVTWSSSAAENSTWVMSGTFDAETLQFEYRDCVKTDYVYGEDGNVASQEEVFTGGHGIMTFVEGDPLTLTWQEDQEHAADDVVFEYAGMAPEGENVGMANPWSDAGTLAEAAEGAGIDGFSIPEEAEISLGEVKLSQARYMEGLAEAVVEYPAVEMTIRKGNASVAEDGDISGDYNEYANTWTQNIKGLEVTCFGNREGDATKTIWKVDDTCYSITAYGLGGDTDYGLSADDLNSLINGIQ